MDKTANITLTKTPSIEEAEAYIRRRFLLVERNRQASYLDVTDNQVVEFSVVVAVLIKRFELSLKEAQALLKNTFLNPYSGKSVFRPNTDNRVLNINDKWVLNTYRKPRIEPNSNLSAQPFLDHLKLAIKDDTAIEFLLDFVAHRYQHQHVNAKTGKPAHALYIYSTAQGQGKSLFTDAITEIFGASSVKSTTTADALVKQNGYQFWERTWLLADEVKVGDRTRLYDNLKARISKLTDTVDPKNRASMEVELPAQLIMTSNHPPTFIEPDDRRFCIIEWDTGLRDEAKIKYLDEYVSWLTNKCFASIAGLLQARDLSSYKPMAPPPRTEAKRYAILESEEPEVDRVLRLLDKYSDVYAFDSQTIDELKLPNKTQRQILRKAGLYKERINFNGKKPTLYIRDGYGVSAGNVVIEKTKEIVVSLDNNLKKLEPTL